MTETATQEPTAFFPAPHPARSGWGLVSIISVVTLAFLLVAALVVIGGTLFALKDAKAQAANYRHEAKSYSSQLTEARTQLVDSQDTVNTCKQNAGHFVSANRLLGEALLNETNATKSVLGGDYTTGTSYLQTANSQIKTATSEIQLIKDGC